MPTSAPPAQPGSSEDNPLYIKEVRTLREVFISNIISGAGGAVGKFLPELASGYIKGLLNGEGSNQGVPALSQDDLKKIERINQAISLRQNNIRSWIIAVLVSLAAGLAAGTAIGSVVFSQDSKRDQKIVDLQNRFGDLEQKCGK